MPGDRLEVRSYRTVFALERRLYRIDRLRLNPSGVPVRGIVYALVIAASVAAVGPVPLLGWALGALPWPARELALPIVIATALTALRIDGRPAHIAAGSLLALALGPRRRAGFRRTPRVARWRPPPIVLIPDGSEPEVRRARFGGPGAVRVAVAHEVRAARFRRRASLRPTGNGHGVTGGKVIVVARRARLELRPGRGG